MDIMYTLLLGVPTLLVLITALYLIGRVAFKVYYYRSVSFESLTMLDLILMGGWSLIVVGFCTAVVLLILIGLGSLVKEGLHI